MDGVEQGLYRYLPLDNGIFSLGAGDFSSRLNDALFGQYWNAAIVFIWTTIPFRMEWRYSAVSHKVIQAKIDAFLGVDGRDEFTVYAAPVERNLP